MAIVSSEPRAIYTQPARLLQDLIRFDTTNPPGNERECIEYIRDLMEEAGVECTLLGRVPERPNLIARLPGRGEAPPLLLQGHLDVVTTANQDWTHPPFEGREADGFIWGRGALDMKGAVAMMVAAVLRAAAEGMKPAGDVVLCALSDEEASGAYGAKWLVANHPELFEGVQHAIGEFGGFSLNMSGRTFYPVMVTEKQLCSLKGIIRGPGGHGSTPIRGGAMAKLGRVLTTLDQRRLPPHLTPVTRMMLEGMVEALPSEAGNAVRGLLEEATIGGTLDAMGEEGRRFNALLHNTVSPTIVRGGGSIKSLNVIPSKITLNMDGRLLPGLGPEDMLREVGELLGDDIELEVTRFEEGPRQADMSQFDLLAGIIREMDPEGVPVPYMLTGVSDARSFAKLGIQTYGFHPMKLGDSRLLQTTHAADERVPVEAMELGTDAMYKLVERYSG